MDLFIRGLVTSCYGRNCTTHLEETFGQTCTSNESGKILKIIVEGRMPQSSRMSV